MRSITYDVAALKELVDRGAWIIQLAPDGKRAIRIKWTQIRYSWDKSILPHLERGYPVGIIPQTVGLAGVDWDDADDFEGLYKFQNEFPPLTAVTTSQIGKSHLYYHGTGAPSQNRNGWEWLDRPRGDYRGRNGYLKLHPGSGVEVVLVSALNLERQLGFWTPELEAVIFPPKQPKPKKTIATESPQSAATDASSTVAPMQYEKGTPLEQVLPGGRDTALFTEVVSWLDANHRRYLSEDAMIKDCIAFALRENARFPIPLPESQAREKAYYKAVSWWNYEPRWTPEQQRNGGLKRGLMRRQANAARDAEIKGLRAGGMPVKALARRYGLTREAVHKILSAS